MGTVSTETLELIRQWSDLLDQQRQMLLQSKWPRFLALRKQGDALWQRLQQRSDQLRTLPKERRYQLLQQQRRIEFMLAGQKHEINRQLKRIRQRKPVTKAYRTWGKASVQQNHIAAL